MSNRLYGQLGIPSGHKTYLKACTKNAKIDMILDNKKSPLLTKVESFLSFMAF